MALNQKLIKNQKLSIIFSNYYEISLPAGVLTDCCFSIFWYYFLLEQTSN